eukprot:s1460_g11.t2
MPGYLRRKAFSIRVAPSCRLVTKLCKLEWLAHGLCCGLKCLRKSCLFQAVPTEAAPEAAPTETTRSGHVDPASPQGVEPTTPRDGVQTEAKTVDLSSPRQEQEEPCSEEESEESEESDGADKEASASPVSETEPLQAVVKAIPVESVSRQAEHALDGAQMCMKVARLASEATGTCRSWSQLLRCGTHLLDSTHCVTQASQSVSRCAVGVPSDLIPLLEKIKTAEGMTRQAVSATRDLMQCTEIISEKGLRATELSNRLLQQSKELASTLQSADLITPDVSTSQVRPEVPGNERESDVNKLDDVMEDGCQQAIRSRTAMLPAPSEEEDVTGSSSLKPSRTAMLVAPYDDKEVEHAVRSRTAMLPGVEDDNEEAEHALRSRTAMWPVDPKEEEGRQARPSRTAMLAEDDAPGPESSTESSREMQSRRSAHATFLFQEMAEPAAETAFLEAQARPVGRAAAAHGLPAEEQALASSHSHASDAWGTEGHHLRLEESSLADLTASLKYIPGVAVTGGAASMVNVVFGVSVIGLLAFQATRSTMAKLPEQTRCPALPAGSISRHMAAACRAIGQACQPVAAASSVVRSARGPRLPTRCGNVAADVDMPQPMLDSWMLEPQCTMFRQYPGLVMLSDYAATPARVEQEAREPREAVAEALETAPAVQEATESPEPARGLQDKPQGDPPRQRARERRAPVTAAAMVMRDYEMRLRNLEVQCRELNSQNARLSSELTAGEVKQQQGRELNLRLSREVQELRRLNAEANAKVIALEEERAIQRDIPASPPDDVQPVQPLTASSLLEVVELVEPPPGLGLQSLASEAYAPIEDRTTQEPELFWGCEQTQIYSASLLLAHRDLTLTADLGPPGLEHPAMDGLRTEEVPDVISRKTWRPRKLQVQRLHRKRLNKRHPKAAAA